MTDHDYWLEDMQAMKKRQKQRHLIICKPQRKQAVLYNLSYRKVIC